MSKTLLITRREMKIIIKFVARGVMHVLAPHSPRSRLAIKLNLTKVDYRSKGSYLHRD